MGGGGREERQGGERKKRGNRGKVRPREKRKRGEEGKRGGNIERREKKERAWKERICPLNAVSQLSYLICSFPFGLRQGEPRSCRINHCVPRSCKQINT